jgi:hypothetical protein
MWLAPPILRLRKLGARLSRQGLLIEAVSVCFQSLMQPDHGQGLGGDPSWYE